ncbi:PREDICTED: BRCA2-interacting transcriptional repressor EMSY [Dufourea novaeangliae]|uniref:Protein EMSY n=1 Tax=Dufourea novaeangliae TaxID=178035 RepID=A0A154NWW0_DUFNO|nr:PREDICTED: BRCA2-interacting transcriptional repressor EMSY [Dufourea novaeangliae]KZC04071.1 Protein EMSY [Dufourea novaeangliae]
MWPTRHETMTRDECRKCLRYLELDAYGSMVSVLRAQGPFTTEKQKLLQELAKVLHISNERHRAEVRRAVNDEKLATIAEQLSGPNTGTDWTVEGRRAIPLLPRLKARSAFTTLANSLSLATAAANKRNHPVHEKPEDAKDIRCESPVKVKVEENILSDSELSSVENKSNEENVMNEVAELNENKNFNINQCSISETNDTCATLKKRKPTSPLPTTHPNKVLVVSTNSIGTLNHGNSQKGSLENTIQLSRVPTNSLQHQNFTIIPLNINCGESSTDSTESVVQENVSNHVAVSSSNAANAVIPVETTSIVKAKEKIITTQSTFSKKIGSAVLVSSNVPCTSVNNLQLETQDTSTQNSLSSSQKTDSENSNSTTSCTKHVVPVVHSNAKPPISTTIITNHSHHVMAVCPNTTVSNGPGPPQSKQITTLTCTKLPTTLNNQTAAKMGVTLNSTKTVNISHHPNTKLASKPNLIVIQKGQTKGVTLSHVGKEVLGKVIVGGKNLCVTSQHNASINVLPRHITLNNGDQAVTMLSATNSSQTESVTSNIKPGNTIMFNLRQEVLEKNKSLSHLFESPNVLTSESKTVIQNTHVRLSKELNNSDSHVQDKEIIVKTDAVITSVKDEKHRSV